MNQTEKNLYKKIYEKGIKKVEGMLSTGNYERNYTHIFQVLVRLRQICDHPALVFSSHNLKDEESIDQAIQKFFEDINTDSIHINFI
jgi:DNA repair protein RAD5